MIDAVVYLIDHPNAKLDKLMAFLPGPDFPTGAIIQGKDGIRKAYETGKGHVVFAHAQTLKVSKVVKNRLSLQKFLMKLIKRYLLRKSMMFV